MNSGLLDASVLDVLHDGTIHTARRHDDGSLQVDVDVEYLAEVLEASSTIVRVRFLDCSSADFTPYGDGAPSPQDLLALENGSLTILAVVSEGEGSRGLDAQGRIQIGCAEGTLRIACSRLCFETESGTSIGPETMRRASRFYWERWEARGLAERLRLKARAATEADLPVVRSLYTELLQVLAAHNSTVNPEHELQSDWVQKPNELFAWLIESHNGEGAPRPVCMALVCGAEYTQALGGNGDFLLYEFVVTEKERRGGIGKASLALILDAHVGEWCLDVLPGNEPAMGFWSTVLAPFEPRTLQRVDDEGIEFIRFGFTNYVSIH